MQSSYTHLPDFASYRFGLRSTTIYNCRVIQRGVQYTKVAYRAISHPHTFFVWKTPVTIGGNLGFSSLAADRVVS